jgi:hypothetical protein
MTGKSTIAELEASLKRLPGSTQEHGAVRNEQDYFEVKLTYFMRRA